MSRSESKWGRILKSVDLREPIFKDILRSTSSSTVPGFLDRGAPFRPAWIDPRTFRIGRIYTLLLNPLPAVRLQSQTTEIHFEEVSFDEGRATLWLPTEVTVEVNWRGRVLRNRHSYSDFKLFNVDVTEDRKAPPQKPEAPSPGNTGKIEEQP